MYFHKPQEKPRKWGSFQDVQYAVMKNCEKIYGVDPDSIVLAMPLFWGLPPLDYSGKNNHGTNHGTTYKDGSLDFDGSNDYVDCGSDSSLDVSGNLTISVRINPNATGTYNKILITPSGFTNKYQLAFGDTNSAYGVIGAFNDGTERAFRTPDIALDIDVYVTMVWNGSSISMYLNKSSVADQTAESGWSFKTGNFYIGKRQDNHYEFNSIINEVRIAKAARTADQIALFHDLPWALYQPVSRPIYFFMAAEGISIPVAMQNMRGGFNPIGMRGGFINAD